MIQYTKDSDGIAIISFDNKNSSVNVIDGDLLTDFELHISNAISDASVKGIIITSSKKDFMLGADLKMIIGINEPKKIMAITNRLHAVLRKTETGGKPVVAAINGTALGGGVTSVVTTGAGSRWWWYTKITTYDRHTGSLAFFAGR